MTGVTSAEIMSVVRRGVARNDNLSPETEGVEAMLVELQAAEIAGYVAAIGELAEIGANSGIWSSLLDGLAVERHTFLDGCLQSGERRAAIEELHALAARERTRLDALVARG